MCVSDRILRMYMPQPQTFCRYTLDPHSAVGVAAARQHVAADGGRGFGGPAGEIWVSLACAHWAKFAASVGEALGKDKAGGLEMPSELASLEKLPTRYRQLPNSEQAVKNYISLMRKVPKRGPPEDDAYAYAKNKASLISRFCPYTHM